MPLPTPDDFRRISQEYADKQTKATKEPFPSDNSFAVIGTPPSQIESVLDAFYAAVETPIVKSVLWPPGLASNHPIRSVPVHVRLWNAQQWAMYWKLTDAVAAVRKVEPLHQLVFDEALAAEFWYVIAISTCDQYGNPIFKLPAEILSTLPTPHLQHQLDSALATFIRSKFDGPAGRVAINPIWQAAMMFNGIIGPVENRDAKNSDTTANSESSTAL